MTHKNAAADAARATKRRARLGPDAVCSLCGFSNADALTPLKRSVIEEHHVLGRQHDGKLVVPICANCHTILTEAIRRAGGDMKRTPDIVDRAVSVLRALGALLKAVGQTLLDVADWLVRLALGLDHDVPAWRETARAQ